MKKFLLLVLLSAFSINATGQVWYHYFNQYADSAASLTAVTVGAPGFPYLIYQDGADGNRAKVKSLGPSFSMGWQLVDSPLSVAGAADLCIKWDPTDTGIYILAAFQDSAYGSRAHVSRYNGIHWDTLGSSPFVSDTEANNLSLSIDKHGTPYLAYTDIGAGGAAVVKKFNGTSWTVLGATAASPGTQTNTQLAIDTAGHVYVAYQDLTHGGRISVRTLSDTGWAYVGPAGFSLDTALYIALAISRDGTPYVAYSDISNGGKAMVAKYDGVSWNALSSSPATEGRASEISMVVDSMGVPYVAYRDDDAVAYPSGCSVRKFNGSVWVYVGSQTFSYAPVQHPRIAISEFSFFYVTYSLSTGPYYGRAFVDELSYAIAPGFKNLESSEELLIWPNPTTDEFCLTLTTPITESLNICISDLTGKVVQEFTGKTNANLNLDLELTPGVYKVSAKTAGGIRHRLLIVQ